MQITYNGINSPQNMVTFTSVPNILKVSDNINGRKAQLTMQIGPQLYEEVESDSYFYISFLGDSILNTMSPKNNNNKRFYVSQDEDSTAMNIARALRCCPTIASEFNIIHSGDRVQLVAKTIGSKWNNISQDFITNLPNDEFSITATNGTAQSVLYGGKIDVDVYTADTSNPDNYLTTLEKNFYGNECAFDVSPLLTTISKYEYSQPYYLRLQLIRQDGEWQYIGQVSGNSVVGYVANQSNKYLTANATQLLMNPNRNDKQITLYTYSNEIPYSVLCPSSDWTVNVSLKNSANQEIYTMSDSGHHVGSDLIGERTITIPQTYFQNAFYVDLTCGSQTIRFNVIKPLRAAEYYQRILWRNEYGGVSFFDFTASRSESDSVDIETYEKNIYDYYNATDFESKIIYANDYSKSVTLKSHLMEESGKWIFNSLMNSKKVWTVVNNKTYYIIPKSISVDEDSNQNNIYTCKLTYEYSDL